MPRMGAGRAIARSTLIVSLAAGCAREPAPSVAAPPPAGSVPAAVQQQPPPAASQATVTASRGQAELQRGPAGSWSEVHVGDRLGSSDALRTRAGEADLAIDGVRLRLHESSGVRLRSVEPHGLRARVHGSVESDVVQGRGRLDVEVEESDAVAHSEGGHFYVTADGRGVIAVAAVTGTVHLSSAGKSVDLNKGEISRVLGAGPAAPTEALRRVLLSVEWPKELETNQARLPISGRVEAGSRVFVQGQPVPVDPGGAFRTEVPLRQGRQQIAVVTVDALGRRKISENAVLRDDSLPEVQVKKKLWQWH